MAFSWRFDDDLMVYIYIHNGICHQLAEISFEVIENHHFEKLNHRTKWVMVSIAMLVCKSNIKIDELESS